MNRGKWGCHGVSSSKRARAVGRHFRDGGVGCGRHTVSRCTASGFGSDHGRIDQAGASVQPPNRPPATVRTERARAARAPTRAGCVAAAGCHPLEPASDIMPASETLGAVSTVRQSEINKVMPSRPSDLLTTIPGVATPIRGDDPGTAINIRGLQDFGRVNTLIDGARQNFQRSGHNANGMFYLEPELISTIDVIRGPVANVFGSGAIGGIASFRTKDVEDVLKAGERWGVLTNLTGSSNLGGVGSMFAAARCRRMPISPAAPGGRRETTRTAPTITFRIPHNRVWTDTVKATFRPAEGHQIKLGYIDYDAYYKQGSRFRPDRRRRPRQRSTPPRPATRSAPRAGSMGGLTTSYSTSTSTLIGPGRRPISERSTAHLPPP